MAICPPVTVIAWGLPMQHDMAFAVGSMAARIGWTQEGDRGRPHRGGQMQRASISTDEYCAARHEGGELQEGHGRGDGWRIGHGLYHALHEGFLAWSPGEQGPNPIAADQGIVEPREVEFPPALGVPCCPRIQHHDRDIGRKPQFAPYTPGKVLIRLGERDGEVMLGGRHAERPQQLDELLHHRHIRIEARTMAVGQYATQWLPAALPWNAQTDGSAAEVCQERALPEPLEIDAQIETGPPEVSGHVPRMA